MDATSETSSARRVVHDEAGQAYRLFAGETELSHAEYAERTDDAGRVTLVFHHTFTFPPHRENGYADEVVRAALDDVAARGLKVIPQCWVVADVIAATPRYAHLVA